MLVLTRKVNESVQVQTASGEVITITVTGFRYSENNTPHIRLGFDAPKDCKILRQELVQATQEGGENAIPTAG